MKSEVICEIAWAYSKVSRWDALSGGGNWGSHCRWQTLGSCGGSLGSVKVNTVGLDVRNLMKSPEHRWGSVTWFFVNLGLSVKIWAHVSGTTSHMGMQLVPGGKSCPVLIDGAWVGMTLAALAHRMAVGQPRSSSRISWMDFVLLISGDGSIFRKKFFPQSNHGCPCGHNRVETWAHILNDCSRFINGDHMVIKYFVLFLTDIPGAFAWSSNIT